MISDLDRAIADKRAPWTEIERTESLYTVFRDAFAVTPGHLLFVPAQETWQCLAACYQAAYEAGAAGVTQGQWDAFNIGQNVGEAAGQTVMYPHVHMIPRRQGDCADPTGGVRGVISSQQNYKRPGYIKP